MFQVHFKTMLLDVLCVYIVLLDKTPWFLWYLLFVCITSIHKQQTIQFITILLYVPWVNVVLLDKTPWFYIVSIVSIYVYISTFYVFMLLLSSSSLSYEPILVLGALLRQRKIVTNTSYIICLPVLISTPQWICCNF